MGAWGSGSFENDDAMDWVGDLKPAAGEAPLRIALRAVATAEPDAYIEALDCSVALAAAEAVAAAKGRPAATLPDEVTAWAAAKPAISDDTVGLARAAIRRITEASELKELWEESDSADAWHTSVSDLSRRIG
jgi:hypothetical protein